MTDAGTNSRAWITGRAVSDEMITVSGGLVAAGGVAAVDSPRISGTSMVMLAGRPIGARSTGAVFLAAICISVGAGASITAAGTDMAGGAAGWVIGIGGLAANAEAGDAEAGEAEAGGTDVGVAAANAPKGTRCEPSVDWAGAGTSIGPATVGALAAGGGAVSGSMAETATDAGCAGAGLSAGGTSAKPTLSAKSSSAALSGDPAHADRAVATARAATNFRLVLEKWRATTATPNS